MKNFLSNTAYLHKPRHLWPLTVLLAGVLLSFLAGLTTSHWVGHESDLEFSNLSERVGVTVQQEIDANVEALRGLQGLFVASDDVTRAEFRSYVQLLGQSPRFADIHAIGFARHITAAGRAAYEARVKRELAALGEADEAARFAIRPQGDRPQYLVMEYIHPFAENRSHLGHDLLTVPARSDAVERTRKTYQPALSERFSEADESASYALIAAVPPHAGQAFTGTVSMVFRPRDLIGVAWQKYFAGLDVEIYETAAAAQHGEVARLVYDSGRESGSELIIHSGTSQQRQRALALKVGDREWTLVVTALPEWTSDAPESWLAPAITVGGFVVTLLLYLLTLSLAASRQRAEARFTETFDFVPVGLLIADGAGRIQRANPQAESLFGYARGELTGQSLGVLLPKEIGGKYTSLMTDLFARNNSIKLGSIDEEVMACARDGRLFPIEAELAILKTKGVKHLIASVRDVSSRVEAARALQAANTELGNERQELADRVTERTGELLATNAELRILSRAVEQSPVSIVITDPNGTIEYVNPKFEQVTGYTSAEAIGRNPRMLSSGSTSVEDYRKLWAALAAKETWHGEFQNRRKDGALFWESSSISPIVDQRGQLTNFVAVKEDITERKQAEQALLAAKQAAEHANRAKDSFLATMSHEIRTPLGGLTGMLELLSLTPLDAEQSETLQTARDSGRSLLRILNDILDWSKIEEGKLELAPQATSMADLVAAVANTYAHVAGANSVTLSQQVDARLSPAHLVDPLRLSQVLNNFVSNAIKFSHGGRVELRAELVERIDDAEQVRFSVQDNGIGIAPEVQQRLFQQYSQASADTARMYGGTGLGLAICRRLADLMDGQIEVQSALGQGSTFSITLMLPMAATAAAVAQPQSVAGAGAAAIAQAQNVAGAGAAALTPSLPQAVLAADAPLILVVDDNPINRKLMVRQLGLLGFRAESAENGELALTQWRAGGYALVITDCHMPVMDGYELARQIRASEAAQGLARTPILAWTANALPDEIDNCRKAGMDELLVKPAELVQLKALLAKWLPPTVIADSIRNPVPATTWTPDQVRGDNIPAVDTRVLAALVGDDPATIREFLQDFRLSAKASAAELLAACAAGDAVRVSAQAHKLKSAARAVGALGLGELCEQMEQAGNAGQLDALPDLALGFRTEMAAVEAALPDLTSQNQAGSK